MRLYLLGGNGSQADWFSYTIPYFEEYNAQPLELPGFGSNPSDNFETLDQLATALITMTEPRSDIFSVGVNCLVVLRSAVIEPNHFNKIYLLAPVGAFLWKRKLVKLMRIKPLRKFIHWLLRRDTRLFKSRFTQEDWSNDKFSKITNGYRNCRAFQQYFEFINNYDSLTLLEWIEGDIELLWGTKDGILDLNQVCAWDSILPRANLKITIKSDWGHYPYLDDPTEFASYFDEFESGRVMHSKSGRLFLAQLAGIDVPQIHSVNETYELKPIELSNEVTYAIRSSSANEDQIDQTSAGKYTTYLDVVAEEVPKYVKELIDQDIDEVIIQEYIDPVISGVAFVRNISHEIEFVEGHLEKMVDGSLTPHHLIVSKMTEEWNEINTESMTILRKNQLPLEKLRSFLDKILEAFHYQAGDIEWAYDGVKLWMLQFRPMSSYQWRRVVTSANLDEILPQQVSKIMEYAQTHAARSISRVYELWDNRVLEDEEPFSVKYNNASYVNIDLFLSRFRDWGLPSKLLSNQIGGHYPEVKFNIFKFVRNIPKFLKMQFVSRSKLFEIEDSLVKYEDELNYLLEIDAIHDKLVNWFTRFYVFIVQTNIIINAVISSSGGSFLTRKSKTLYSELTIDSIHRVPYESDPASKRPIGQLPPRKPFPKFGLFQKIWHKLGLPGLGGIYFQIREWFRDTNMRLFYKLHFALEGSTWLEPFDSVRERVGTFWQSGEEIGQQQHSVVIYPGSVEGILGDDILVVHALEPGHIEKYKTFKGVIAQSGGKLSHGATLLRELQIPSAIISSISEDLFDTHVKFENGSISSVE